MATKDHWSSKHYNSAAGFVPKLTSKVVSYLDVQPTDDILDIGCGDGSLTSQIAQAASSGHVLGLDASQSFIETAAEEYSTPNCSFMLQDCSHLDSSSFSELLNGTWDKVFSNAAMHWILRDSDSRVRFFENVSKALKPNGKLVFEMGGSGNVAEVQAAATSALIHSGISIQEAREANPWFFPSTTWMKSTLQSCGFDVEICEHEYRATKLTEDTEDRSGGLEGWVKLMCGQFLERVSEGRKRDAVAKEICDVLEPIITRHEDGSRWLGYCRLRAVARKK